LRLPILIVALTACSGPPSTVFQTPAQTLQSDGSRCFAFRWLTGNFDGAGLDDLAVFDPLCDEKFRVTEVRITFFYRGSSEEYSAGSTLDLSFPEIEDPDYSPTAFLAGNFNLSVANLDGDGVDDLVIAHAVMHQILVLGTGDVIHASVPGIRPLDLDNDGVDELVVSEGIGESVYRLEGRELVYDLTIDTELPITGALDIDGDGLAELLLSTSTGPHWRDRGTAYIPGCDAPPGCFDSLSIQDLYEDQLLFTTDLNGDDRYERWEGDAWGGWHLAMSDGNTWSRANVSMYPTSTEGLIRPHRPRDLDDDGDLDVFFSGHEGRYVFLQERGDFPSSPEFWQWQDLSGYTFDGVREIQGSDRALYLGYKGGDGVLPMLVVLSEVSNKSPAPEAQTDLECPSRSSGLPDLGVDTLLIEDSLEMTEESYDAESCEVRHGCVLEAGDRRLLRFSVSIVNYGEGDAVLPGPMSAPELYEFDECHGHHHVKEFASYDLLDPDGNSVVAGRKQGYRLGDVHPYCKYDRAKPFADFDEKSVITAGWGDIYHAGLPCQWIDASQVPPGDYVLRVNVDIADHIEEDDVFPNSVEVPVTID
jgi:hypothetical protein